MNKKLKLKEIVVIAMMSAIIGVVFTVLDSLYKPLQAVTGPLGGDIINGVYLLSSLSIRLKSFHQLLIMLFHYNIS